ncbi:ATP-binding cassette domain-containing protein [Methylobacterium sp. J-026]|uniref:ABC transporter ATP-binding protein/permease n=1 Tax=Methylobacterium sp. J-026 TaxID=2836624 RepID=UPI001FBBC684|nr:ATP-binding cassette domain-containing protein [Methylobacterium sp. J-026]MCJ2134997.1 ATP-binding cassette domain-containing protein [Methylobacterium sp. J-026]
MQDQSVTGLASAEASRVATDPGNFKLDTRFARRLWAVLKPYWLRRGAWPSWLLALAGIVLSATYGIAGGYVTTTTASLTNQLVARNASAYWPLLFALLGLNFLRQIISTLQILSSQYLNVHWRGWLTTRLIDQYLSARTYYEISLTQSIDNPDQRIQEQVEPFCEAVSRFPRELTHASIDVGVQVAILASISRSMLIATLAYVGLQIVLNYVVYRPLIRKQWDVTVAEADLRYGLLHVRDHAETIAFYQGEAAERTHLLDRLRIVLARRLRIVRYALVIAGAGELTAIIWHALPAICLAPVFFAEAMDYGTMTAGIAAASMIVGGLSVVSRFIPSIVEAAPTVVRIAEIQETFNALAANARPDDAPRITLRYGSTDRIALRDVSVQTPAGERHLVERLTLSLGAGERLLIVGRTGIGKSSLLRAMAGLWTRGQGTIEMPDPATMMFLPQRPYMPLGDLRLQLTYPRQRSLSLSDGELQAILERVHLPDLAEQAGGFAARRDWGRILSLGEQQRIAFARILASRPRCVFLDEATSALDPETEQLLYHQLRRTGATVVSVAHRPSLTAYHDTVLRLSPTDWTLERLDAAVDEPAQLHPA